MNKRKIAKAMFLLLICLTVANPMLVLAHSGRTDANGGHWDRKTGTYHYHNGGGSSGGSSSSSYNRYTTVRRVYAKKVNISNPPKSIMAGKTVNLKASTYPANAEDDFIEWSSSNNSVATVDAYGTLEALMPGKAVITAKTAKGTSTKFTVVVKEVVAKSIHINSESFKMYINSEIDLDVNFVPQNTTNQDVLWISSDSDTVSVDEDGVVKANALGVATITVAHGELEDSIQVEVVPILAKSIRIEKIDSLEYDKKLNIPRLKKSDSIKLSAKLFPSDTTDKTIMWSVDDDKKASVDDDGTLVAKKSGVVTVKAETKNGKTDTVQIKVYSDTAKYITSVSVILVLLAVFAYIFFKKH